MVIGILTFKQCTIWHNSTSLWEHAIKTQPSARAYDNLGSIYKEEKKYDLAIQQYNEAIKINIADHEAYTNRGNVYFELNKPNLAFADYKKALAIKPDYVSAMDNVGALFGLRLQYDSALIYLNKALTANPRYMPAYKNRALVNLGMNRNEDALKDFRKLLEYDPADADIMNIIGVCYRNMGKYNDALLIINQAILIKPDPHFYLNRSYCYNSLNDKESARKDALIARQGGLQIEVELARSLGIQ